VSEKRAPIVQGCGGSNDDDDDDDRGRFGRPSPRRSAP
jgi:hypothetical protein